MASPRIYPGQTVSCRVSGPTTANLYVASYGLNDEVIISRGDSVQITDIGVDISMPIPSVHPIFEVGLELPEEVPSAALDGVE